MNLQTFLAYMNGGRAVVANSDVPALSRDPAAHRRVE